MAGRAATCRRQCAGPRAEALEHIYGYTCVLDITVRSTEDRSTRRSFDSFTPLGPWVGTTDEIDDPVGLELRLIRAKDGAVAPGGRLVSSLREENFC
jgi:2-keto-4-pentenoate hydratase/2-oxohepta-3-ene-1,7-dioic acid hydratase in catechol pathway